MNAKQKSTLGAIVLAIAGVIATAYVPEENRETFVAAVGLVVGWLGFRQPGTEARS